MSRFLKEAFRTLVPYTPGEQPQNRKYIKLNTNESPFPPAPEVLDRVKNESELLRLYPDPDQKELRKAGAVYYGIAEDEIIFVNGSDEILAFAFEAFCDENTGVIFPDISYGFYSVYADKFGIDAVKAPLKEDFTINVDDYINTGRTVFIANPNAPTGIALPLSDIERIVAGNPDNIVVVDEAYVDFGGESALPLIHKYNNLLVTQTFSKSRSLAGGRLGMGMADREIIRDLNTVRNSTNPYNINRMTLAAGVASFEADDYFKEKCETIKDNREFTVSELKKLDFEILDSKTNFIFVKSPAISGDELFKSLREAGILVRHFTAERIREYNRITIGSRQDMESLISCVKEILENNEKI